MNPLQPVEIAVLVAYYGLLAWLCLFSAHRLVLLLECFRLRTKSTTPAENTVPFRAPVCIQLPLYNEPAVAARLIDSVCRMDYPNELLEIQVLDDSTDETTSQVAALVAQWQERGKNIAHIRRSDRTGYKAGALDHGLALTSKPFVAIFDADFIPQPDFLLRLMDEFHDDRVGMVQARWEHLNANASLLTRIQAIYLDAHFRIEHFVRSRKGRFFNFNGTAGIWRREAIEQAGGWQHDTLTEDLDLSYRAQLQGWKFVYRDDVSVPSELPPRLQAYRSQQHRWSKGAMQTARKMVPRILASKSPSRYDAVLHVLSNTAYVALICLLVLLFPLFIIREMHGLYFLVYVDLVAFVPTTIGLCWFFGTVARLRGHSFAQTVMLVPALIAFGVGMSLNNGIAALEGLCGHQSPFIRTPKFGKSTKSSIGGFSVKALRMPLLEILVGAYLLLLVATALYYDVLFAIPYAVLFAAGFAFVAAVDLYEILFQGNARLRVMEEKSVLEN